MDLKILLGNVASFVTIASNFSGLPTCRNILKRKSTTGVSYLPFLASVITCSLWLHYGLTVRDTAVTVVNIIALFLQSSYLLSYYYATSNKVTLSKILMPTALILFSIHYYSFNVDSKEVAAVFLGILSSCGSIAVSAAPLPGIKEVFKTKSTESLPFLIIFGVCFTSTLWFLYGLLANDLYIQVPNFIATAISGFQLSLFIIFDSKSADKKFE